MADLKKAINESIMEDEEGRDFKDFSEIRPGDIGYIRGGKEKWKVERIGTVSQLNRTIWTPTDVSKMDPSQRAVVVVSVDDPEERLLLPYGNGFSVPRGAGGYRKDKWLEEAASDDRLLDEVKELVQNISEKLQRASGLLDRFDEIVASGDQGRIGDMYDILIKLPLQISNRKDNLSRKIWDLLGGLRGNKTGSIIHDDEDGYR